MSVTWEAITSQRTIKLDQVGHAWVLRWSKHSVTFKWLLNRKYLYVYLLLLVIMVSGAGGL